MINENAGRQKIGDDFYVAAVTIAATLDKVIPVAENISLGAMNTMALTARAEQSARGFRPITDFMQELANDVRRLTGDVNRVALEVSRTGRRSRARASRPPATRLPPSRCAGRRPRGGP